MYLHMINHIQGTEQVGTMMYGHRDFHLNVFKEEQLGLRHAFLFHSPTFLYFSKHIKQFSIPLRTKTEKRLDNVQEHEYNCHVY